MVIRQDNTSVTSRDLNGLRNFGLDAVRALAISLVLLAHFAKPLASFGVFGVEIFFVLSGYLIGGILHRQFTSEIIHPSDLWLFWRRRWYRTLPNYYLFLVVLGAVECYKDGGFQLKMLEYLVFLQNLAWPIQGLFQVSWSLAVEEWFYLLFPLVVFALNRSGLALKRSFVAAVLFFMVFPFFLRVLESGGKSWDLQMRMVVVFRLDALMYGVGLALLKDHARWLWRYAGRCLAAGLLVIGLSVFLLWSGVRTDGIPIAPAFLFSLIPFGVALALPAMEQVPRPRMFLARPVHRLSEWSYSIYLSHMPVLFACYELMGQSHLNATGKLAVKVAALVVVLLVSRFLYLYYELPLTHLRPASTNNRRPTEADSAQILR